MRKLYSFLLCIFCAAATPAFSQLTAGSGAAGMIIGSSSISISASSVGQTTSSLLDLNCDSVADMRVVISKGPTAIDGPNYAWLYVLNPIFDVCADTSTASFPTVNYYSYGDPLNCAGAYNWRNDSLLKLGDYGCMSCPGPYSISNKYIAYRNSSTSAYGWIKLSFDLIDGGGSTAPIWLTVPEALSPCGSIALSPVLSGTDSCGTLQYSFVITPVNCPGSCNGAIQVSGITGGSGTLYFNWSPGSPTGDGTSTITSLCTGNYTVQITDSGTGDVCYASFFVPEESTISFNTVITNVSCYGGSDGSVCLTGVSGGSPPYAYTWSNGSTGSCSLGLPAGAYNVCAMDGTGCMACTTAVVMQPTAITVAETVVNACSAGCCDGSASITAMGGTPGYTYLWMPSGATTPSVGGLCPGEYDYCVTDMNGCTTCDSVYISFPTGMNDLAENNISVYPNPGQGIFTLSYSGTVNEIEVLNVLGETIGVIGKPDRSITLIDLSSQPEGIYFARMLTNNGIHVTKLVVSR